MFEQGELLTILESAFCSKSREIFVLLDVRLGLDFNGVDKMVPEVGLDLSEGVMNSVLFCDIELGT
uniref:Uncharacterized protein n=1 Tax=Arion vulgaris TaxID=1028688 RepID=A0A0B7ADB6_9EUPU